MQAIHHLIRSGNPPTDDDILGVIRTGVLAHPDAERRGWFKQLELSLDGYGGALSQRADRVRALLAQVESEMQSNIG